MGLRRGKAKIVSARPGTVCAPTGGSGHFLALIISTRAGSHAYVVVYGLRWPRGTHTISARSRLKTESGAGWRRTISTGDQAAARPPGAPVGRCAARENTSLLDTLRRAPTVSTPHGFSTFNSLFSLGCIGPTKPPPMFRCPGYSGLLAIIT